MSAETKRVGREPTLADLRQPLSELDKAELSESCQKVLTPAGMLLLRRLMFQVAAPDADARRVTSAETARPPSSGCTCHSCGLKFRMDVQVPDSLWERIKPAGKPEGAGLLCGPCILARIEGLGGFCALTLTSDADFEAKRCRDLEGALRLILPLARCYADIHPTERNTDWVIVAERILWEDSDA